MPRSLKLIAKVLYFWEQYLNLKFLSQAVYLNSQKADFLLHIHCVNQRNPQKEKFSFSQNGASRLIQNHIQQQKYKQQIQQIALVIYQRLNYLCSQQRENYKSFINLSSLHSICLIRTVFDYRD